MTEFVISSHMWKIIFITDFDCTQRVSFSYCLQYYIRFFYKKKKHIPIIYQIRPIIRPSIRAFFTFLTNAPSLKLSDAAASYPSLVLVQPRKTRPA